MGCEKQKESSNEPLRPNTRGNTNVIGMKRDLTINTADKCDNGRDRHF